MPPYKIECIDKTALEIVKNICETDSRCVVEGLAILTTHSFNELEVDLSMGLIGGTTGRLTKTDLEVWNESNNSNASQ